MEEGEEKAPLGICSESKDLITNIFGNFMTLRTREYILLRFEVLTPLSILYEKSGTTVLFYPVRILSPPTPTRRHCRLFPFGDVVFGVAMPFNSHTRGPPHLSALDLVVLSVISAVACFILSRQTTDGDVGRFDCSSGDQQQLCEGFTCSHNKLT